MLTGEINFSPYNRFLSYRIYRSKEEFWHLHFCLFSFPENNMSCEVSETERRKLPLKISRLFGHGQNNTLDITSFPSTSRAGIIQAQLFFVDLSFSLVIFCHPILLQGPSSRLQSDCIISNNAVCNQQTRARQYISAFPFLNKARPKRFIICS